MGLFHDHAQTPVQSLQQMHAQKSFVALFSVLSNTTLVVLKLIVGLIIGSVSVISEAIHSGVDLLASLIAYYAVRQSAKPADGDHPYGHAKFENISGAVEALLIFVAAGWIVFEAVKKLLHPQVLESVGWGIAVMSFSALLNQIVSHWLFKVGRATHSVALEADGWHLRTDVYTSAGVMAGLMFIWLGKKIMPEMNFSWLDPVFAICVAALIVKAAYELTNKAVRDLLDESLPAEEQKMLEACIRAKAGVKSFHRLRTRKAGSERFVEFHMLVDPEMSVYDSHRMTDELSAEIDKILPSTIVTIHVEPCSVEALENEG